jgi:hypothetical protein
MPRRRGGKRSGFILHKRPGFGTLIPCRYKCGLGFPVARLDSLQKHQDECKKNPKNIKPT